MRCDYVTNEHGRNFVFSIQCFCFFFLCRLINWSHVLGVYTPHLFYVGILALVVQVMFQLNTISHMMSVEMFNNLVEEFHALLRLSVFSPAIKSTVVCLLVVGWVARMENPVYLLAFDTFKAPESWKVTHEELVNCMRNQKCYTEESLSFMKRLLSKSATGQATAWPPVITETLKTGEPSKFTFERSREEAQAVLFDIVAKALEKARMKPEEIDFLVINCSLFSPTPSLCAMVTNHFGFRSDCETYNLSGMGCSASPISIKLAKNLLKTRESGFPLGGGATALVVSTEIISNALYLGNERKFLLQNTLFRCGGAAIVLSNKWTDGRRAWYKLLHAVRVQGNSKEAYECVYETQDENSCLGVALSKDIVKVAGKTMEKNFVKLGPLVLPLLEQAKVVLSIIIRTLYKLAGAEVRPKMYVPDFKKAVEHFCIHAGGRAVIDGIEKNMDLRPYHTEASRMTLLNYGNTSSSSIWYELEYIHYHQKTNPIHKGDRVLQIAFGSGFKCNSCVWVKL